MNKKKLLIALTTASLAISLTACKGENNSPSDEPTAPASEVTTNNTTTNNNSNASYTIGYGIGSNMANDPNLDGIDINNDKVIQGFSDALTNAKPAVSEEAIASNLKQLRETVTEKMNAQSVSSFLENRDSIVSSDLTPKTDNKGAKIAVYEFFDYQCMYCAKVYPELEKLMDKNPNVEFVFVEFPIFGERSPASEYAAEVGSAIYKLYGGATYVKYHDGIFATGEDEGKLKDSTIDKVAKDSGADIAKVKATIKSAKIAEHLKDVLTIGSQNLGIQGTPYLVVAPIDNANESNTTVIAGYTSADNIQRAIDDASSGAQAQTETTYDNSSAKDESAAPITQADNSATTTSVANANESSEATSTNAALTDAVSAEQTSNSGSSVQA
ncbi:DsbA family protein [Francisella frigiditurris]|uniref:Domain amino terminal to FKBP-type peptidyl-prolyl isomerase family protein n=1 Tax=Francisella frigiditurris TaxID=1542390 RepID=A0A1J0KVD1_9GAMM|nr:thioredoxin domain-containing protein [Francisella frigiditurris]APC97582.1 domain amino terminal to FKBP-type peptidyl-prolyl isomerase family protein [Francisella frigiditurris]